MFKVKCPRCDGAGKVWEHSNVLGGVCFKCHGVGFVMQKTKPAKPAQKWAVFGLKHATGEYMRLFNVSAKTENSAIETARDKFANASSQFKDDHSLEHAKAIAFNEMKNPCAINWQDVMKDE